MRAPGLSERIEEACRRHRDAVATWQADGRPVTFANYFFTVAAFAEALSERGVGPKVSVACEVVDAIAGTALKLAALRLGATVLPGLQTLDAVRPDLRIVSTPDRQRPGAEVVVTSDWIRSPRRLVPVEGGGRMVKATSGTTGLPKLRVQDEAALAARLDRGIEQRGAPGGTVFVGYNPGASPGFNTAVRALLNGAAQVHLQPAPALSLAAMERFAVKIAFLSPWNFEQLLMLAEGAVARPSHVAEIRVGGGEVAPGLCQRAEAVFGCPVINTYGSNETGSIAHHRPALTPGLRGVVGKVYPDFETRFVGSDGAPADPGEGGELWLRLPQALWVRDYPSGVPLCDEEGWQRTGDLARVLPGGELQLLGRAAEILNVGGNKMDPARIEVLAEGFPGLDRLVAFRAPSDTGMDHVGLAAVAGEGFDEVAFVRHMAEKLGPRFPLVFLRLDHLPVTEAGKIDRASLTCRIAGSGATKTEKAELTSKKGTGS